MSYDITTFRQEPFIVVYTATIACGTQCNTYLKQTCLLIFKVMQLKIYKINHCIVFLSEEYEDFILPLHHHT